MICFHSITWFYSHLILQNGLFILPFSASNINLTKLKKKQSRVYLFFFCFYLHHQSHGNFYKKKQVGFIEYHKLLWTIEICCGQLIYSNLTKTGLPPYFIQPILCTTLSGSVETDACFTNTKFSSVHKN